MTDIELLQRFGRHDDEAAFAEVVRRHTDLVFNAALRHAAGDRQAAEDITQEVFADLAQKALRLERHPCLAGWLYASTRFSALNTFRSKQRRIARETEVILMTTTPPTEPQWEQIRPVIDDALEQLDEDERSSIVLRFFEQQTFASIGAQLGLSENAAQKRVTRALDQLNVVLTRHGISSSAAALELALVQSAVAAPTSLAATLATAALTERTAAPMSAAKLTTLKLLGFGAAAVAGLVGGIWYQAQTTARHTERLTSEFMAKLDAAESERHTAAKRASDAEADTAKLLRAIEEARAAGKAATPPVPRSVTPTTTSRRIYIVRRGDTGQSIAKALAVTPARLNRANPTYDFSVMMEGDELIIPSGSDLPPQALKDLALRGLTQPKTPAMSSGYVIAGGDSLETISEKTGLSADELKAINPGVNWSRLRAGQEIKLK